MRPDLRAIPTTRASCRPISDRDFTKPPERIDHSQSRIHAEQSVIPADPRAAWMDCATRREMAGPIPCPNYALISLMSGDHP